jgi:hypothetical protein
MMLVLLAVPAFVLAEPADAPTSSLTPVHSKLVRSMHGLQKTHKKPHKVKKIVLPIAEIRDSVLAYIKKTDGDASGVTFPKKPPAVGICMRGEHCKDVYYLQPFTGPHGQIGGQAIITATVARPSVFTVITLAAGASDTVEGFEAYDIPASAAKGLLR